jgi:hypothetical protein
MFRARRNCSACSCASSFRPRLQRRRPAGAASSGHGKELFANTGCGLCHTPSLTTGNSNVAALRNQSVRLDSRLARPQAIELQASRGDSKYGPSEARAVLGFYKSLSPNDTQDLRNFPRSL